jgi:hypothetical protein
MNTVFCFEGAQEETSCGTTEKQKQSKGKTAAPDRSGGLGLEGFKVSFWDSRRLRSHHCDTEFGENSVSFG